MPDPELSTDGAATDANVPAKPPFPPANDPAWTREEWYLEWTRLATGKISE